MSQLNQLHQQQQQLANTIKPPDKSLSAEVRRYKEQLLRELTRREKEAANVIFRPDRDQNRYKIDYKGKNGFYMI